MQIIKPGDVLCKVFCSLDPVTVHKLMKSISLKGGNHYTSDDSQSLSVAVELTAEENKSFIVTVLLHHASTVPDETAVMWWKPMSKQHAAVPTDVRTLWLRGAV